MSRFFTERFAALTPYTPGEQPQERKYIKLNTNESPFPPSPGVSAAVAEEAKRLQLYSDPESRLLTQALAERYGLHREQVLVGNGSDELLNFAFMAFCDEEHPALFPDISYGFYPVYAQVNRVPYRELPLDEGMNVRLEDYDGLPGTVFLANPNAPTGIAKKVSEIENLIRQRPDSVVVVDEAYVDFGAETVLPLVDRYENLLVIRTYSKSRSMAGARLGFALGSPALIGDLNTLKYSTNPYNVNRMTSAAGIAALREDDYYTANARTVAETRDRTAAALRDMGFVLTDSKSNFLFARHPAVDGATLYRVLKERGILIRHFDKARIADWVRITVGTQEQMSVFLQETEKVLTEYGA
ncbi:MAG: histidinol-phosphate transaminase [Oscillospiraceae bacterium]|nr:histidinol-phosphate transaminase [Oscillospiraceae bacterium]